MSNPYQAPRSDPGRAAIDEGGAVEAQGRKLAWYEQAWTALPFTLVLIGGLIGGACGGLAWGINQKIFRATKQPFLRYFYTGMVTLLAVVLYFVLALALYLLLQNRD